MCANGVRCFSRAGFALPVVDADRRTVRYPDLLALMRDLRGLGLTNALLARSRRPMTRRLLLRLMETYAAHFAAQDGRISATFEIIYLTAWSPHETSRAVAPGECGQTFGRCAWGQGDAVEA